MFHIALHFIVPLVIAFAFYRDQWRYATFTLVATMIVDVDHLLADPIYDPNRCSIGFHPLHTTIPIIVYFILFLLPFFWRQKTDEDDASPALHTIHLVGLGLLIHMGLDWIDCF